MPQNAIKSIWDREKDREGVEKIYAGSGIAPVPQGQQFGGVAPGTGVMSGRGVTRTEADLPQMQAGATAAYGTSNPSRFGEARPAPLPKLNPIVPAKNLPGEALPAGQDLKVQAQNTIENLVRIDNWIKENEANGVPNYVTPGEIDPGNVSGYGQPPATPLQAQPQPQPGDVVTPRLAGEAGPPPAVDLAQPAQPSVDLADPANKPQPLVPTTPSAQQDTVLGRATKEPPAKWPEGLKSSNLVSDYVKRGRKAANNPDLLMDEANLFIEKWGMKNLPKLKNNPIRLYVTGFLERKKTNPDLTEAQWAENVTGNKTKATKQEEASAEQRKEMLKFDEDQRAEQKTRDKEAKTERKAQLTRDKANATSAIARKYITSKPAAEQDVDAKWVIDKWKRDYPDEPLPPKLADIEAQLNSGQSPAMNASRKAVESNTHAMKSITGKGANILLGKVPTGPQPPDPASRAWRDRLNRIGGVNTGSAVPATTLAAYEKLLKERPGMEDEDRKTFVRAAYDGFTLPAAAGGKEVHFIGLKAAYAKYVQDTKAILANQAGNDSRKQQQYAEMAEEIAHTKWGELMAVNPELAAAWVEGVSRDAEKPDEQAQPGQPSEPPSQPEQIPPAAQRTDGQVYLLPNGKSGKWNAQAGGWEIVQ